MRLRSIRQLFRISSRKFYDIVNEKTQRLVPTTPEQFILSKHLKGNKLINGARNEGPNSTNYWDPKLKKINYRQIIERNPHGSVIEETYKGITLNMLSLNFKNVSIKDINEYCSSFDPDLIIIQGRPETYLPRFRLLPKHQDAFSDKLYLEQLILNGKAIREHILSTDAIEYFDSLCKETQANETKDPESRVFITDSKGLVEDEVILTASYYSSTHQKQLLMAAIPEQAWREWICNSHTLMEIQELFKLICKNVPFYQSLGLELHRLACLLKPDLFLNLQDRYMATLMQMAIATRKYKKILAIFGTMQNQAVYSLLQNKALIDTESGSFTPIVQYLVGPPIKSSILRNVSGWEIIEKQLIFDILKEGQQIVDVPMNRFEVTNRIAEHYGIILNSYPKENIQKFRYDKIMEYLSVMRQQIESGKELRKKFMLREAIRVSQQQI